jgi:hypothetical protein
MPIPRSYSKNKTVVFRTQTEIADAYNRKRVGSQVIASVVPETQSLYQVDHVVNDGQQVDLGLINSLVYLSADSYFAVRLGLTSEWFTTKFLQLSGSVNAEIKGLTNSPTRVTCLYS